MEGYKARLRIWIQLIDVVRHGNLRWFGHFFEHFSTFMEVVVVKGRGKSRET